MSCSRPPSPSATASTTPAAIASTAPGTASSSRPASRVGALEHVLARQVEVARPRRDERGEQRADVRRLHLRRQLGDGAAIVGRAVEDARRGVRLDRRQPGDDADRRHERRVAGGDGEGVDGARPTSRARPSGGCRGGAASAATSSANVPTVPSGCGELPPAPGRSTAISRTPTAASTASSGWRARRESGVPWTYRTGAPSRVTDVVEAQHAPVGEGERRGEHGRRIEAWSGATTCW